VKSVKTYLRTIKAFIGEEKGVTVIEYSLLMALIALVVAGVAILIGSTITGMFSNTAAKIDSAGI
jgi:Flp pilus assembly pilin Flp